MSSQDGVNQALKVAVNFNIAFYRRSDLAVNDKNAVAACNRARACSVNLLAPARHEALKAARKPANIAPRQLGRGGGGHCRLRDEGNYSLLCRPRDGLGDKVSGRGGARAVSAWRSGGHCALGVAIFRALRRGLLRQSPFVFLHGRSGAAKARRQKDNEKEKDERDREGGGFARGRKLQSPSGHAARQDEKRGQKRKQAQEHGKRQTRRNPDE